MVEAENELRLMHRKCKNSWPRQYSPAEAPQDQAINLVLQAGGTSGRLPGIRARWLYLYSSLGLRGLSPQVYSHFKTNAKARKKFFYHYCIATENNFIVIIILLQKNHDIN